MTVQKVAWVLVLSLALCGPFTEAFGDLTWSKIDLLPELWPDSSPPGYGYPNEVFNATAFYNETAGTITIIINTNFREAGLPSSLGGDSYYDVSLQDGVPTSDPSDPDGQTFSAGDLYIAYALDGDVWNPDQVFGIGMTDHTGNVVTQAYDDDASWGTVEKGHIYSTPTSDPLLDWATGTYEGYDGEVVGAIPPDADNLGIDVLETGLKPRISDTETDPETGEYLLSNTYPTLLKNPTDDIGLATVAWSIDPAYSWPDRIGLWDITIEFDASVLGLTAEELADLAFFWSQECGNDGVLLSAPVGAAIPEPATVLLLGSIAVGTMVYSRRKK